MSVGLDAKAAYGFHSLRDHPGWGAWLTAGRLTNQLWYSVFSCTSGAFGKVGGKRGGEDREGHGAKRLF